jgi:hypothetical protein
LQEIGPFLDLEAEVSGADDEDDDGDDEGLYGSVYLLVVSADY